MKTESSATIHRYALPLCLKFSKSPSVISEKGVSLRIEKRRNMALPINKVEIFHRLWKSYAAYRGDIHRLMCRCVRAISFLCQVLNLPQCHRMVFHSFDDGGIVKEQVGSVVTGIEFFNKPFLLLGEVKQFRQE